VIVIAAFESPAIVADLDDVAMVSQAVEQRGRYLGIAEYAGPLSECSLRAPQRNADRPRRRRRKPRQRVGPDFARGPGFRYPPENPIAALSAMPTPASGALVPVSGPALNVPAALPPGLADGQDILSGAGGQQTGGNAILQNIRITADVTNNAILVLPIRNRSVSSNRPSVRSTGRSARSPSRRRSPKSP
jgi:hypothetical protein